MHFRIWWMLNTDIQTYALKIHYRTFPSIPKVLYSKLFVYIIIVIDMPCIYIYTLILYKWYEVLYIFGFLMPVCLRLSFSNICIIWDYFNLLSNILLYPYDSWYIYSPTSSFIVLILDFHFPWSDSSQWDELWWYMLHLKSETFLKKLLLILRDSAEFVAIF